MIYGFYDIDFMNYTVIPFNLDLMKLSTYHKKRRDMVILTTEFIPDKFRNYYFFKDYDDGRLPDNFYTYDWVKSFGMAFHPGHAVPLPIEVEETPPDLHCYERVFELPDWQNFSKKKKKLYEKLFGAQHMKLSLDGHTVWRDLSKQFNSNDDKIKTLFLYDWNLNEIKYAKEAIKDLRKYKTTVSKSARIGNKFPIQVNNSEDLFEWCNIKTAKDLFLVQYNGLMEDAIFPEYVKKAEESFSQQMLYNVTDGLDYNYFITEGICRLYLQILYFCNHYSRISLIYDDNYFIDKRWVQVMRLFSEFLNLMTSFGKSEYKFRLEGLNSMYAFCSHKKSMALFNEETWITKEEAREIFGFVRENNYELFKMFYEFSKSELKGGELVGR